MNPCNDCIHFPICEMGGLLDPDEKCVDRISAVEVKGHWIRPPHIKKTYRRLCSECGHTSYFCGEGDYPYCPYCKASMKEEDEDDAST